MGSAGPDPCARHRPIPSCATDQILSDRGPHACAPDAARAGGRRAVGGGLGHQPAGRWSSALRRCWHRGLVPARTAHQVLLLAAPTLPPHVSPTPPPQADHILINLRRPGETGGYCSGWRGLPAGHAEHMLMLQTNRGPCCSPRRTLHLPCTRAAQATRSRRAAPSAGCPQQITVGRFSSGSDGLSRLSPACPPPPLHSSPFGVCGCGWAAMLEGLRGCCAGHVGARLQAAVSLTRTTLPPATLPPAATWRRAAGGTTAGTVAASRHTPRPARLSSHSCGEGARPARVWTFRQRGAAACA